jgi:hypothetical protein
MKRFSIMIFLAMVLFSISAHGQNPFTENEVDVTVNSSGEEVRLQTAPQISPISADDLRKAFEKLAEAQKNFAELLRQLATNPQKFMQNGSLSAIYAKVASIQKRLGLIAEKLLEMSKNSGVVFNPPTNSNPTNPGNTPSTNPPTPRSPNSSGQITSRSPQFSQWFANGANIAKDWNFPDITNMYGQKVTREDFLRSIIFIESSGVHQKANGQIVTSSCGALGFMQLMPNTAKGLGVNPRDPAQNIQGGAKLFKTIFNKGTVGGKTGLDKLVMAGCAYNMGPYSSKLKKDWTSFLSSSAVSKGPKMYGLKIKMCLGITLTSAERRFVEQYMAGKKSVDEYARSLYSYAHGIGK